MHEAKLHEHNSFVTLTYSDEHLPRDGVSKREMQLFLKRLRFDIAPVRVRFFCVGEYGGKFGRPHYHVVLFGYDFSDDRTLWRKSASGFLTYRSARLERLWPFGHSEIGTVTVQSAGYAARYCLKKVNGAAADEHYQRVDPETGEVVRVNAEFIQMSNRPGIGRGWLNRWGGDAFPSDFVIVDGKRTPVPRYYTKQFREGATWREERALLNGRVDRAAAHAADQTPERLATREECAQLRANRLLRAYEDGES